MVSSGSGERSIYKNGVSLAGNFRYTKLNNEKLELASKSLIARTKEFNAGTLTKEVFETIKKLHADTEGFTKMFKWVKV